MRGSAGLDPFISHLFFELLKVEQATFTQIEFAIVGARSAFLEKVEATLSMQARVKELNKCCIRHP